MQPKWFKYALMNWRTCGICIFSIFNSCVCIILLYKQMFSKCAHHSIIPVHRIIWSMRTIGPVNCTVFFGWMLLSIWMVCPSVYIYVLIWLYKYSFFWTYSSFHFQVPYPMFSAIYSIQTSHIFIVHEFWVEWMEWVWMSGSGSGNVV